MIRGYSLTNIDIELLIPIMEGIIFRLEMNDINDIELSIINLGPSQFMQLLEILGYERDRDWDTNGWEQDTWYYYHKEGHCSLCLHYEGYSGEIIISKIEEEGEEYEEN